MTREPDKVAAELAALRRDIDSLSRASQGRNRTIENGTLRFTDASGTVRTVIGAQGDGGFTVTDRNGPIPPPPSDPVVTPISGGVRITWDGTFAGAARPSDFREVRIHVSHEGGTPAGYATFMSTFPSTYGGVYNHYVLPGDGPVYVKLVTVSTSGKKSSPSREVTGLALPFAGTGIRFFQDTFTLTAAGAQDVRLAFTPLANSEHVYCNGLYQREKVSWTRSGKLINLLATPSPPRVGDRVVVEYAYLDDDAADTMIVPFGSSGWSVLTVAPGDVVDRSAVTFDDSSWTVVGFPSSDRLAAHPDATFLLPASSPWPVTQALWARRHVTITSEGGGVILSIRVDDYLAGVWWNGTQVAAPEPSTTPYGERTITVPAELMSVDNVLAVKFRDFGATRTYADIQIVKGG